MKRIILSYADADFEVFEDGSWRSLGKASQVQKDLERATQVDLPTKVFFTEDQTVLGVVKMVYPRVKAWRIVPKKMREEEGREIVSD